MRRFLILCVLGVLVMLAAMPAAPSAAQSGPQIPRLNSLGRGSVTDLAISPDDARVAVALSTGRIEIYDRQTLVNGGQPLFDLVAHRGAVLALDFAPDGTLATIGQAEAVVKLWEPLSRSLVAEFAGIEPGAIAFNADGRLLAIGARNANRVTVFTVEDRRVIGTFSNDGAANPGVYDIAFAPDNSALAVAMAGGTVVFDLNTAAIRSQFPAASDQTPRQVQYNVDGSRLYIGTAARVNPLLIYNTADSSPVAPDPNSSAAAGAESLSFSSDGQYLAATHNNDPNSIDTVASFALIDPTTLVQRGVVRTDSNGVAVSITADNQVMLAATPTAIYAIPLASLLGTGELRMPQAVARYNGFISAVAFDFGSSIWLLQDGGSSSQLVVYDSNSRQEIRRETVEIENPYTMQLRPGGLGYVVAGEGHLLLSDGSSTQRIENPFYNRSLQLVNEGAFAYYAGTSLSAISVDDINARLADPVGYSPRTILSPIEVRGLLVSTDGRRLVVFDASRNVAVIDTQTSQTLIQFSLELGATSVDTMALAGNGSRLVVWGDVAGTPTLHIIDLNTGTLINGMAATRGTGLAVTAAAISSDGSTLATVSTDNVLRLWSANPLQEIASNTLARSDVRLAFNETATRLIVYDAQNSTAGETVLFDTSAFVSTIQSIAK